MSIFVTWDDDEQTAIRMAYEHYWNWRDHFLALDAVNALLASVDHPVDLILDLQESMPIPESTAWNITRAQKRMHLNWSGRAILITPDGRMARAMLDATPGLTEQAGPPVPA